MTLDAADVHTHEPRHGHGHGTFGSALREVFAPHRHAASDSIDGALESSAAGIRAVKISLLALGVTAVAQLVIVSISGSVALLADTIHNFSDALTAIALWVAFALCAPGTSSNCFSVQQVSSPPSGTRG